MKEIIFRTIFVNIPLLFFLPVSAIACSCFSGGPPCQSFGNTDAVFSGKVESVSEFTMTDKNNPRFQFVRKSIKFTVTESFRGVKENSVEIITGRGGGDCGYPFETGKEYLVYANENKETGKLGTGICTRTRPIEKAEEDLQYFREIAKSSINPYIYGSVFRVFTRKNDEPYRKPEPLANVTLSLSNGEKVKTNEKGEFRFDNLLPQEYTLTPTVPQGLWGGDKPEYKLKLNPNGCAVASFALYSNTSVSGRILDENSNPPNEISVQLVPVDQINTRGQSDMKMAFTDKDGRYIFHEIPSGDYYLGVRLFRIAELLFPYPRTFYPNTLNLNEAKVISIKEGDVLKDFDIKLGQKLGQREVSGIVVFPDGKVAPNSMVSAEEVEYSESSIGYAFQAKEDGTFTLKVSEGLRYIIRAVVSDKATYKQSHAEPIEIPARGNV
ncbi:MAG: hypothetical protein K1X72_15635, partial [Pyrinomonadaceae bacterium]|nr:hypothetical protein [Pyrinomonadaceae bacterium]